MKRPYLNNKNMYKHEGYMAGKHNIETWIQYLIELQTYN